ncbi:MAG: hypothetical protein ACRDZX_07325 [Acidimicrobiales bacterium]
MTMPWPAERSRSERAYPARGRLRALVGCNPVSGELPLIVDGSRRASPAMAEHLRSCLRCQAELAGYRRLLQVLRSLKDEPVTLPAPDRIGDTLRALQDHLPRGGPLRWRATREPWLVAGVAAVGLAAVALTVLRGGAVLPRAPGLRAPALRAPALRAPGFLSARGGSLLPFAAGAATA